MSAEPIKVPAEVLEGLESIRASGKVNMMSYTGVMNIAFQMGYDMTYAWMESNKKLYSEGVFRGFEEE